MKPTALLLFLLLFSLAMQAQNPPGKTTLFDAGWRFHRGGAQGAEKAGFDDAKWQPVDLPHDWSIEDLPGTSSPFHPDAISQTSGGFTTGGTGWYRKTFVVPAAQKGQRVQLQFDGIYMNAEVWLNGQSMGRHPYGYTSFWYDVTDKVKFGESNVVAVEVKNEGANSRWYSGSGIYRHVWLTVQGPVHIEQWGTYLTTPDITATSAQVKAETRVLNQSAQPAQLTLVTRLRNPKGKEVARTESKQTIAAGAAATVAQTLAVKSPERWSVDKPALYTALTEVYQGQQLLDQQETPFGIRTISFDAQNGFRLNGQAMKLKGGCFHHDNGPLGAKAYDRAEERKIELLKASGYNAIRCSHNPPSPALLAACDRLGMLVIDEAFDQWREAKNPFDYHLYFDRWWQQDVASMVLRDRNHPSIILWSLGNEIPERGKPEGAKTARELADFIRTLDTSRPITAAVNGLAPDKDPYFAELDVAGYNYAAGGDHHQKDIYAQDHARLPNRVMYGSETYPLEAFDSWMKTLDHPYVIGDFVWTAFDYIGEASIGWLGYWQYQNFYPWNLAFCGDIDICGWKRPQSYYRDALWQPNQVSLFVKPPTPSFPLNLTKEEWSKWEWRDVLADWNWPGQENKPLTVEVYSSCEQVELQLNGKSLGTKPTNRSTQYTATWTVPYQPGELKAIGRNGNKQVGTAELRTAAQPTRLALTADRASIKANSQDLSYITVELLDSKGVRHPKAESALKFELSGPGTIVGVGNANPTSTESYQRPQRNAWQGRALVVVKSGEKAGKMTLRATAEGLPAAEVTIVAR
ncbi:glycoside hydrolase family 2 TIM barrel-domain containing protein [Hymenobacter sp. YC55]|uniref:glycoside hydrolase family 2 TIM barrel-domain containing protein n=1 Tax=Hymenobacter sp. YC55 TaxID=3034019 RepID=UPI0023F7A774|nr:glycoside hydrolase family 2 TIM barrel-domain containing protein [Hymenobacter sp. YC55]MDF7811719.1 glycoside hydrolase family 2 TIM barrel-domain containing protein [Hymenobacter sp. YC55]